MANTNQLQLGQVILKGLAQAMADGTWGARCLVQDHTGPRTDESLLQGGYYANEAEAISAGLQLGVEHVNKHYPN